MGLLAVKANNGSITLLSDELFNDHDDGSLTCTLISTSLFRPYRGGFIACYTVEGAHAWTAEDHTQLLNAIRLSEHHQPAATEETSIES